MAEVGLVASVFGIASLAASVSKTLFDLGYTMRHAREQIHEIAGEVTTFTTIIRQLGVVLKTQKGSFTDEAEKMVESSMKDCKRLCKTIRRQVRRKKESLVPVRWLFKKKRAEELKRRMDALRSVLGLMLQVVQMGRKIESDATVPDALSELREEMKMLKNEVLAYHRSLPKLQEAERDLQTPTHPIPNRRERIYSHHGRRSPVFHYPNRPPVYRADSAAPAFVPLDSPHRQQGRYEERLGDHWEDPSIPVHPYPGNEYDTADSNFSDYAPPPTPIVREEEKPKDDLHISGDEVEKGPVSQIRPLRTEHGHQAIPRLTYHASQRLIAAMPYNPTAPIRPPAGPARLTASTTQLHARHVSNPTSPDDEATNALKLLFTRWTKVNPRLIEDVLDKDIPSARPPPIIPTDPLSDETGSESDASRGRRPWYDVDSDLSSAYSRSRSRHRPHSPHEPSNSYERPRRGTPPLLGPDSVNWGTPAYRYTAGQMFPVLRDAWRSPQFEEPPLAKLLATVNARFVWMVRNPEELTYWVDGQACVRYRMTPPSHMYMMPEKSETILPKQWVLKEVAELFGFVCNEDGAAHWVIDKTLTYVEVRQLVEVSSHLIEKDIRKMAQDKVQNWNVDTGAEYRRPETSNVPPPFPYFPPDQPPGQHTGPLLPMPGTMDVQLTRGEIPPLQSAADSANHPEEKTSRDNDGEYETGEEEPEESMSVLSSQISYKERLTPSRSNKSNQGGTSSSSNVSPPSTGRKVQVGTESRKNHDPDRTRDSKFSRYSRDERKKVRPLQTVVSSQAQSQATDTGNRRRHRDRKRY
ncbi:hypothetical protein A1O1_06900 [Capronia coronata CBS 617.96]|uniref:Fungal N-terminal domain-containing protein n=1 Tax=Capronia coronata CBS 617.96 TaxID=1182541 RepID=W9Y212_9EURO|nr:uncharacterized protein A1O1_06900 [Capronia coronata CBS 617.96]EXJ83281.1 hypothetical protein A1O1_06900 [Capronia coronata CBS 617.96]